MIEFKIPEVGENIESGTVVDIMVSEGDTVEKDQDLLELETDKASLPVPSPVAGTIKEITISKGDEVKVGQVVMKIEESGDGGDGGGKEETEKQETEKQEAEKQEAEKQESEKDEKKPEEKEEPPAKESPEEPQKEKKDLSEINLCVVGAGPGGYAAAFFAADLGMNVTLIDKDINPGGVCLFRGCIPSKALLHAAKVLAEAREASEFGIDFGRPKVNLKKLRDWKNKVVEQLTGGLGTLAKQRKVTFIQGEAAFTDSNAVAVKTKDDEEKKVTFDKAILATGSSPISLPFAPDSDKIMDSTSALEVESVPEKLLLIGGGYIGLELGTVYAELGSDVTVVEMLPQLMTGADRDLARVLEKRLKEIFKDIFVETKVTKIEEKGDSIEVTLEDKDGKQRKNTFDKVIVAIGRRPNSKNIGLENTNVKVDEKGFVEIDEKRQTDDPSIYAIGDIAGNPMLAHKASHEGRVAVEAIAGEKVAFEPKAIPAVVFTDPEIAWAGLTETEAKAQGRNVAVAKYPWGASGRALTLGRSDGLTKLIIDPETEMILGVCMVGPGAGELIAEGVLAIEMGANATDLKLSIHAHPTLTETVMEAAEMFYGQSTHVYKPKKK